MTTQPAEISAELPCHVCGYDLRAHPADGKCPECGASVAEARREAAVPRRPAWRDSDPRWRRRILAGVWVLVLMPLMNVLGVLGWTSIIHVPNVFNFPGALTLDETLLGYWTVYQPLIFCIGVVLLFSKERGRRRNPLDWTRRWGILCSYLVLPLSAAEMLYIDALVLVGISALFLSMPLQYQPRVTNLFAKLGATYLLYGAYPKDSLIYVLVALSSITMLLACAPLYDALRCSGSNRIAAYLLAPLALFSLVQLAQAGRCWLGLSSMPLNELSVYEAYFQPQLFVPAIVAMIGWNSWGLVTIAFGVEAMKWCIILTIAIWLSIAQFKAWRRGKKGKAA